jgi:hypothetical protein
MMHPRTSLLRVIVGAAILSLPLLLLAPRADAGTTGSLVVTVTDSKGAPLQGVVVSVTSPSQSDKGATDVQGHVTFASLAPDTYDVTFSKAGFNTQTIQGIDIIADNVRSMSAALNGSQAVCSRGCVGLLGSSVVQGQIVRPGTGADVYSVSAAQQSKVASLGGGGGIDNAYSAIASVPGAFVPPNQTGWNQPIFLRGGDFTEIGYELDGVPLNRSFDHIPTTNLSTLGQQQLQVYTGGEPADAESNALSGYVNQVIKQGTYPGTATLDLGIGDPALYNKASLEVGGATPDKRFTYYVGTSIINQDFRYRDQQNGASFSNQFGNPFDLQFAALGPLGIGPPGCGLPNGSQFTGCYANHAFFQALPAGPGGYVLGPYPMGKNSNIADRENVANLHFGIPRANGRMDDFQLLYDTSELYTYTYSSYLDWGGSPFWQGVDGQAFGLKAGGPPFSTFVPGFAYLGPLGQPVSGAPGGPINAVLPYLFPGTTFANLGGPVPLGQRDASSNGQSIIKGQFQHNFSSDAYIRGYVYSAYSNWFVESPNGASQIFIANSTDRELSTHTTGFAVKLAGEINGSNLVSAQLAYSTSQNASIDNQQTTTSQPAPQSLFAALVNTASPLSGICNSWDFNPADMPQPSSCEPLTAFALPPGAGPAYLRYGSQFVTPPAGFEWLALENGATGPVNEVKPKFGSFSMQDEWHPTARIALNVGVRFDRFEFDLPSTAGGPTRAFWFNAWNTVMCANRGVNGGNPIDETLLGLPAGAPCSLAGPGWVQARITNSTANGATLSYSEFQPRFGGTYTFNDDNVFRFSLGGFAQPPATQFLQYNTLQQNLPAFIGGLFFKLGYTTPEHDVRPAVSYNADVAWEHKIPNSTVSFSLTPFYRVTRDQVQQFFIDPTTGTISGVNAGRQTVAGAEFALTSGNFNTNGVAAQLSVTYTHSRIRYDALPNGSTLLSPVNSSIQQYNSFTSACASAAPTTNPNSLCGIFGNSNAVATEASGVANPYFNERARPLLDPNGLYPTYDVVPTGLQLSSASYGIPIAASLVVSEHQNRWTVAPILQFIAGSRYGAPQQQVGVDPSSCAALNSSGTVTGDPRYPHGGTGNPYDAPTCTNTIFIPDQFTGNFDTPGAFREPSFLTAHVQVAYDLSSRATLKVNLLNVYARCFGGDSLPWTSGGRTCGYDVLPGHIPPVGNIFNPGDAIQPIVRYPYGNLLSAQPFNAYADIEFKL